MNHKEIIPVSVGLERKNTKLEMSARRTLVIVSRKLA